jgi:hypothetical protein
VEEILSKQLYICQQAIVSQRQYYLRVLGLGRASQENEDSSLEEYQVH